MSGRVLGRALVIAAVAVPLLLVIGTLVRHDPGGQHVLLADVPPTVVPPSGTYDRQTAPPRALVLVQGLTARRLVVAPLDGSAAPQDVDRDVASWPLLPSPDQSYILYSTQRAVMVLDVVQRRAAIVGSLDGASTIVLVQWAPDSHALAYVVQTASQRISYYALPDGSTDAQMMVSVPYGLPLDVGWLPDGRPVSIYLGLGPVGGFEAHRQVYTPTSGESVPLPPDVDVIQPWSPLLSPDGTRQIYAAASWDESRYQGACRTGPLAISGEEWLYATNRVIRSQDAVAFELPGIFMDRPTWLHDGRVVFRGTADKVCTALDSGLYVGTLGGAPQKLVTEEPDYVSDDSDKLLWSTSYAINSDETLIAWSENRIESGHGAIHVMPLDGGPTGTLFETAPLAPDAAPFAFRDQEMILYFVWLS